MNKPEDYTERGSAMIEFIALGTMLFIPTVYFLLTVFALQAGGFAASSASQQAIMVARNLGEDRSMNLGLVNEAAAIAVTDYGIDPSQLQITAQCLDAECDRVTVRTAVTVELPLIPWVAPGGIGTITSEASWWGGNYR